MEKKDFIERIKALHATEDVLSVSKEVNELRSQFEDFILEEERLRQVELLEAQANGETVEFEKVADPLKDEFYEIYSQYKEKRIAVSTAKKLQEEANLRLKKNLIERLKLLIEEEENIGAAIAKFKEIQESWKEVGDIPRDKRQDIQSEYSKAAEMFFHTIKIYRELKDHDLKRNFQLKSELVQRVKDLFSNENIKELEATIKTLQNEWEEIGPVPNEEWENIKNEYWESTKTIYAKIHAFYEGKREELKQNIDKKTALLEETTAFIASVQASTIKEWEETTEKLLAFQEQWKGIGFGTKKENEELWQAFRAQCDAFFAQKKAFYESLRAGQNEIADKKRKLVERATVIKDSTDWKKTTDEILRIQQEWKKLGNAGQRNEQGLWKEFRSACDSFFNNKQKHFEEQDKQNETNLAAKLDIISKIESYVPSDDKKQVLNDLKEFSAAFNAVGKVPFKEKDTVYNAYKSAIDAHYTKLKLEGEEKEKAMFQARLDTLKANPDADKAMERERRDLQQKIQVLHQDNLQFENNLGFFGRSKGAEAMIKEIEAKITANKRKIDEYKRKIKMLVSE
jgi:hypothetical protein